ncbi:glycine-rich protein GRP33-like [Aricia agestis]|uniref:glycine-rich protein GRP33-like n=1 Tax=Aricia agestis TaxID=91739 RepID=UPI001C2069A8|nr:glycine-rich protein GRP33-like [Aricia agestis]
MADKYDKNGFNSGQFRRNSNQENAEDHDEHLQDGEEGAKINEKAGEYVRELLSEKIKLNTSKFPMSTKLIDQEVAKVQSSGRIPPKDFKYLDVYKEKPIKVTVKVLVPVKEHPKVNFIGKLLGPKGNTMKQLQEETMCKMAILGRGSMRDRQKEEELRNSLDPKYAHLTDELHVEVSALASPAEAHARIAYALAEVKKYLRPDPSDMMRQPPMRDIMERGPPMPPPSLVGARPPGRMPPGPPRPMNPKSKVFSILDRARTAMDTSYGYDDHYAVPEPPVRGPPHRAAPEPDFYYDRNDRFYEEDSYYKDEGQEYKTSSREVGTRRPVQHTQRHYARPAPYQRQPKAAQKKH